MTAPALKVLVVDDEEGIRETLRRVLAGCEVLTAADGTQALRLAEAEKPDVVLLDVNMPGLDGLRVLELLLKGRPAGGPAVLMVTVETELGGAVKALSLGAYAYITKPFEAERVRTAVAAAAEERARRLGGRAG